MITHAPYTVFDRLACICLLYRAVRRPGRRGAGCVSTITDRSSIGRDRTYCMQAERTRYRPSILSSRDPGETDQSGDQPDDGRGRLLMCDEA